MYGLGLPIVAFQQVFTDATVGDAIAHLTRQLAFPPLILAGGSPFFNYANHAGF